MRDFFILAEEEGFTSASLRSGILMTSRTQMLCISVPRSYCGLKTCRRQLFLPPAALPGFESRFDNSQKIKKSRKVQDFFILAEEEGFEPPWACTQTVFKTASL